MTQILGLFGMYLDVVIEDSRRIYFYSDLSWPYCGRCNFIFSLPVSIELNLFEPKIMSPIKTFYQE